MAERQTARMKAAPVCIVRINDKKGKEEKNISNKYFAKIIQPIFNLLFNVDTFCGTICRPVSKPCKGIS